MSMEKRTFTKEEKLEILKEATAHGVTATLEKFGIYPATYYSWRKEYDTMGEVPCSHSKPLDGVENEYKNEMIGADSFLQPSV